MVKTCKSISNPFRMYRIWIRVNETRRNYGSRNMDRVSVKSRPRLALLTIYSHYICNNLCLSFDNLFLRYHCRNIPVVQMTILIFFFLKLGMMTIVAIHRWSTIVDHHWPGIEHHIIIIEIWWNYTFRLDFHIHSSGYLHLTFNGYP